MAIPPVYSAPTLISVGSPVQYVSERGSDAGAVIAAQITSKNTSYATNGSCNLKVEHDGDNGTLTILSSLYDPAGTIVGTWRPLP